MSLWSHIACCVDDSPGSTTALAEARRLRAQGAGKLSLVHVAYGPPGGRTDPSVQPAQAWLEEMAAAMPIAEPVVLTNLGRPAGAVCSWAEEGQVDLLVASAHRGVSERILLGSFAGHLVHHAPCPVLLVRPTQERRPPGGDTG